MGHFTVHQPEWKADEREKSDSSSQTEIGSREKKGTGRLCQDLQEGKENLSKKKFFEGENRSEKNRCFFFFYLK